MNSEKIDSQLSHLESALRHFDAVLAETPDEKLIVCHAALYRFQFAHEHCRKILRACLLFKGGEVDERIIEESCARRWLDDKQTWKQMIADRNDVIHEYDCEKAEEIFQRLPSYRDAIRATLEKLREEFKLSPEKQQ